MLLLICSPSVAVSDSCLVGGQKIEKQDFSGS